MSNTEEDDITYDTLMGPVTDMGDSDLAERAAYRAEEIYEERSLTGKAVIGKSIGLLARGTPSVYNQLEDTRYVQRITPRMIKSQHILEEAADEITEEDAELNETMLEE